MHVCGLDRAGLIVHAGEPLNPRHVQQLRDFLSRRRAGEPVAYITGSREFWSLGLRVSPHTLIPRPETEILVEQALARIPRDAAYVIADLGTGSGAVALALASERHQCRILATDMSAATLAVARDNARRLGLDEIEFREGAWLSALGNERLDMIVSNPPYVRDDDPHLDEGDLRFEPPLALRAGIDGLNAIRILADGAREHLRPGAWLLLEHGHDQGSAVAEIVREHGYRECESYRDLAGHARVIAARRP